jgi:hypothetical protein
MEVEFSLTVEDLQAFQRYYTESVHRSGKAGRSQAQMIWAVFILLIVGLILISGRKDMRMFDVITFILLGAVLGVTMALYIGQRAGKLMVASQQQAVRDERNRRAFGSRRYRIAPDGITTEGEFYRIFDRWPGILEIAATVDHAFFYITDNSAYIVPRRAFRDALHFEEFVNLARRYHEEAGKPTGIITGLPGGSTAFTRDIE